MPRVRKRLLRLPGGGEAGPRPRRRRPPLLLPLPLVRPRRPRRPGGFGWRPRVRRTTRAGGCRTTSLSAEEGLGRTEEGWAGPRVERARAGRRTRSGFEVGVEREGGLASSSPCDSAATVSASSPPSRRRSFFFKSPGARARPRSKHQHHNPHFANTRPITHSRQSARTIGRPRVSAEEEQQPSKRARVRERGNKGPFAPSPLRHIAPARPRLAATRNRARRIAIDRR